MARMSLDTAIRLSAEVKGGGNIDRVKKSLQDLGKNSQVTARDVGALRSATFQFARANDNTIAGIRNSIAAFRGLQEQARIGSREFRRYSIEIQQLEQRLRGLDGPARQAGESLGKQLAAGLAAAGIGQALRGITMQAGKFDAELRKAAAIEGGAGAFGTLRKEIEAVAAVAAGTPTEVAALATALSRAGFSAEETTQSLRSIVRGAEATAVSFEEMGSIAADNLRAFGLATTETSRVVDILTQTANKSNQTVLDVGESMKYAAPVARTLGVDMQDLAGMIALMANAGIRGSDAGTGLRMGLFRLQTAAGGADEEIQGLTRGNVALQKAMAILGSQVLDTEGKLRPLDQVIIALKRSFSQMSTTEQAILSRALFGTEAASKFLATMNFTEAEITKMFGQIRNSGGVAAETQKKMQGFDYSIKVLGGNVEYLTNQIGGMIGAALQPLIDTFNTVIFAAQQLPEPIKAIGAAAAAAGVTTLGLVVAVNALKAALAAVGGIKAATAALIGYTGAANASAVASNAAAVSAGRLMTVLGALTKIGVIAIGVKFVIEGLDELLTGVAGVQDAENAARSMAERRGLTYVPSPAVTRRNQAASAYVSPFAGARDAAFARAQLITGAPAATPAAAPAAASASAGGGGGAEKAAKAQAESLGAQIAKSLQQALNLTPAQAAGVVGNLIRESGLNPRINEGGAVGAPRGVGGYGLAQWTGSRQTDLVRFAGSPAAAGNLQTQLRFMVSELLGPESRALASLRRTTTPEEAAVVFDRDYERSGIKALGERKANARRVYGEIAGSGPSAGLDDFADQLRAQEQAAEQMRQQRQAAEDLLRTERDRLAILETTDPLQRQIKETIIEQAKIQDEYIKKRAASRSKEETTALEQAGANALMSRFIEMQRSLAEASQDALDPLDQAVKAAKDKLAFDREYGDLIAKGVNPELARQFIELDRIAAKSKENLEVQIATLEAKAAELPITSEIRKELERQVELRKQQLQLIPGAVDETKRESTQDQEQRAERERKEQEAASAAERAKNLYRGIVDTIEDGIIGSIQSGIDSLVDGAKRLDDALKEIASGVLREISNQLLRFAVNAGVRAAFPGLFADGAAFTTGGVQPFANGGAFSNSIVSTPTLFKFGDGGAMRTGLMGEAGPEAIMPLRRGPDGRLGVEAVPFQRSGSATGVTDLEVPFQRTAAGLEVPFMKDAVSGGSAADGGRAMIDVRFETVNVGGLDVVTRKEAEQIGREAAQRGADLAHKRYRNNPSARRAAGIS